jgi:hypothetical protein
MELNIRELNESDYEAILAGWWSQWGWNAPARDFLPNDGKGGVIVYDGDVPVCAGFMYLTNSKVAWVDWIISNKDYTKKPHRKDAIDLLIKRLTSICKESGFSYVFGNNNNKNLIDYFLNNGYSVGCNNSVELIKKL